VNGNSKTESSNACVERRNARGNWRRENVFVSAMRETAVQSPTIVTVHSTPMLVSVSGPVTARAKKGIPVHLGCLERTVYVDRSVRLDQRASPDPKVTGESPDSRADRENQETRVGQVHQDRLDQQESRAL